jgi:plastocyanin
MGLRLPWLLLLIVIFTVTACGDDDEDDGDSPFRQQIIMEDFRFVPDRHSVLTNRAIPVDLENMGTVAHTFTIDELGIDEELEPGERASVTIEENGDWPFYCRFHRTMGMEGSFDASIQGQEPLR